MALLGITILITVAIICLVVYSTLIISSRQDELAIRIREENSFKPAPFSIDSFAFEASEDLVDQDFVNNDDF